MSLGGREGSDESKTDSTNTILNQIILDFKLKDGAVEKGGAGKAPANYFSDKGNVKSHIYFIFVSEAISVEGWGQFDFSFFGPSGLGEEFQN